MKRKIISLLMVSAMVLGMTSLVYADDTQTISVAAEIPQLNQLKISIAKVESVTSGKDIWHAGETAVNFGKLVLDDTYLVFRAKMDSNDPNSNGIYYAVDVGILTNAKNWDFAHTPGTIANASGATLNNNINVAFSKVYKVNGEDVDEPLDKLSYANSAKTYNRSTFAPVKGWPRVYYGLGAGKDDAPGVTAPDLYTEPGTYTGSSTFTLTILG